MSTTTNLEDFDKYDYAQLIKLLEAWRDQGLPDEFWEEEIKPMMNTTSHNVFLTNSEFQAAMMNGDKLEMWHQCGNCGHEGFQEDCQLTDEGCNECEEASDESE